MKSKASWWNDISNCAGRRKESNSLIPNLTWQAVYGSDLDNLYCSKCSKSSSLGTCLTELSSSKMEIWDNEDDGTAFYQCNNCTNKVSETDLANTIDSVVKELEESFRVKINLDYVKARSFGEPVIISKASRKVVLDYMERRKVIDALLDKVNCKCSVNASNLNQYFLSQYQEYRQIYSP